MAITITGSIKDFPAGTTKTITIRLKLNGSYPDITADTVRMIWKTNKSPIDSDSIAVLNKTANVVSKGIDGYAIFSLTPADTEKIPPKEYYLDVQWNRGTQEYIPIDTKIVLKQRVSDV